MQPPSHTTLLVALTAGVASAALGWWRLSTLDAPMEWKDTAVRASPEDVLWFGSDEAWRRLAEVPVHSAEVPPTAREFWQQHISASVPVVVRGAAAHAGWNVSGVPWRTSWLEKTAGAGVTVPVHVSPDRCWSRILDESGEGEGTLLRPARVMMPLSAALALIASDSTHAESTSTDTGCGGPAAAAMSQRLEALLRASDAPTAPSTAHSSSFPASFSLGAPAGATSVNGESMLANPGMVHTLEEVDIHEDLPELLPHIPAPPWAEPLLEPVSTNLWVGSHGKTSVLHFDDYENVLMQVSGVKHITLFDPMQLLNLYAREVPQRHLELSLASRGQKAAGTNGAAEGVADGAVAATELQMALTERRNQDMLFRALPHEIGDTADNFSPLHAHVGPEEAARLLALYPEYSKARPLRVTLQPGDALFIPSLWWHEVVSEVEVPPHGPPDGEAVNVAVNFWYKAHSQGMLNMYEGLRWMMT